VKALITANPEGEKTKREEAAVGIIKNCKNSIKSSLYLF